MRQKSRKNSHHVSLWFFLGIGILLHVSGYSILLEGMGNRFSYQDSDLLWTRAFLPISQHNFETFARMCKGLKKVIRKEK